MIQDNEVFLYSSGDEVLSDEEDEEVLPDDKVLQDNDVEAHSVRYAGQMVKQGRKRNG